MKLTRAQIEAVLRAGDGIAVEYIHGGIVAAGIQFFEEGRASHFLCSAGRLDTIEEDIGGCMATRLDTYLKGKCSLTVVRIDPPLSPEEVGEVLRFWNDEVSNSYGFGSVLRGGFAEVIRHWVLPVAPPLARFMLRVFARIVGHQPPDCSALWVMGHRKMRPGIFRGWDSEEVTPAEAIRPRPNVKHVVRWDRPILVTEDI